MGPSFVPPPPTLDPGLDPPSITTPPPGPESRSWLTRARHVAAPTGPSPQPGSPGSVVVYASALGSNVVDVDGNRYVDLAAGFGSMLLGHSHPRVTSALELQSGRLLQALGDVHPSEPRIALMTRLAQLHPSGDALVILGQSGADAVTAALKTAVLATGKPRVLALDGAYHGLSYAPLAACGLRASYRAPFAAQLGSHVTFLPCPLDEDAAERALELARLELAVGDVGAVLFEPILGRAGCVEPPPEFLPELAQLARRHGALLIADEVWTGLGRAGEWLASAPLAPELICLGKGLGGGLPISAVIGERAVMSAWRREAEVVHTATFSGAPLACVTALATLDVLSRERLVQRSAELGAHFRDALAARLARFDVTIRGRGLMLAVDLGRARAAVDVCRGLLQRGYLASTGGGEREAVVLTPPLVIGEAQLSGALDAFEAVLAEGA